MTPLRTIAFALASFGALLTTSCSSGTAAATCVTGRTVECSCVSGAKGAQTCTATGIFSPCSCSGATAPTAAPEPEVTCESLAKPVALMVIEGLNEQFDMDLDDEDGEMSKLVLEDCRDKRWTLAERQCAIGAENRDHLDECLVAHRDDDELKDKKGDNKRDDSRTKEAREFLMKLYDGARAYYMDPNYQRGSITPIPAQFPEPSMGPTPPLDECCTQGGMCAPDASQWANDTWAALQFSVDDPHYYSYTYITPDPFMEFTVRANGDLDCDGIYSTFEMLGIINSYYSDGPAGSAALARVREFE